MKKLKYLSLLVAITALLVLMLFVYEGDLSGSGTARFDVSPDSEYIVMRVVIDSEPYYYQMLMTPEKEILFVKKTSLESPITNNATWVGEEEQDPLGEHVRVAYENVIELPPSAFQRAYAWLFVNLNGFDIDNLDMKPID
ncbi:hypothetical protein L2750_02250 [Shewanella submarina]|uniref:Uncharacterized protein n=1 Tax=Shewanella submarina TaxID=2016376 RepID=A0ABV7GIN1_9GAMM|nr:hypothetical protein [Shewanella submarina]MCL1035982.1 hypothetical protein [Shewanella submarina]